MRAVGRAAAHRSTRCSASGFTIIELIISVAMLGIIAVAITMVAVTTFKTIGSTSDRLTESRGPRFASVYWVPDVASAETFKPSTAPTVCGAAGPLITFRWSDDRTGVTTVSWATDVVASERRLVRRFCTSGSTTPTTTVVAPQLANPGATVTCGDGTTFTACATNDTDSSARLSLTTRAGASFTIDGVREVNG